MPDGLAPRCNECEKKRRRKMYLKHRQSYIDRAVAYAKKNRERVNERQRGYGKKPLARSKHKQRMVNGVRLLARWYVRAVARRTKTTEEESRRRLIAKRGRRGLVALLGVAKVSK